jgi:FKBP-type peptidyl-prolyl cis-trans isomerase FkpA
LIRSRARTASLALCATLGLAGCSNSDSPETASTRAESTGPAQTAAESVTSGDASAAPPKAAGEVETPSGLRITEVEAGTGASPKPTDVVLVHYHGTFPDGSVFDSSVDRGEPARFPLNRVIPCWTEGLQRMKTGGKSRLVCPPTIAYGAQGAPPRIPANATLIFDVELIGIGQ